MSRTPGNGCPAFFFDGVAGCPLLLYCSTLSSTPLNPFIYKGLKKKVEESRGEKRERGGRREKEGKGGLGDQDFPRLTFSQKLLHCFTQTSETRMVAGFEAGRALEKLLYLAVLLYSPAVRLPLRKLTRAPLKFPFT
jgi:hypothetical protein